MAFGKKPMVAPVTDADEDEKATEGRIQKRNSNKKRPGKKVKDPSGLAKQISKMKKGCK